MSTSMLAPTPLRPTLHARLVPLLPFAALPVATLLLLLPALWNGYPLLYPDSMSYVGDGPPIVRALFLHQPSTHYGLRSLVYCLLIAPLHRNQNAWPVVIAQAAAVAWILWLLVRWRVGSRGKPWQLPATYLALITVLSLLTSLGWYASFLMPDVLGPLVYLGFCLLAWGCATLHRAEQYTLVALCAVGILAHPTHLLLSLMLLPLLALAVLLGRWHRRQSLFAAPAWRGICLAALAIVLAVSAQLALHGALDGHPSLNGERPAYLTARLVADGTGLAYLRQHCPAEPWTLCQHLDELNSDADNFLWSPDGVYAHTTADEQTAIVHEEPAFVRAVFRSNPSAQLQQSWLNFHQQLFAFGLYGFDNSTWISEEFAHTLPAQRSAWLASRQAREQLPLDALSDLEYWVMAGTLPLLGLLLLLLGRRNRLQLAGISVALITMIVANAALTGILSVVDDRYGCRIIWLIPLLAALALIDAFTPDNIFR